MTEKQDMGVVTQSDREAAVDIYNVILHDWHTQHMLDGMEDECYVIQAFKKHRLASQADQGEVLRAALAWIDAIPDDVVASLHAMPGFDRDWADTILATHPQPSQKGEGA